MARYLIVRTGDGLCVGACEWDGDTGRWRPPEGHTARRSDPGLGDLLIGQQGDTWTGSSYSPAPPPPAPPLRKASVIADILRARPTLLLTAQELADLEAAED